MIMHHVLFCLLQFRCQAMAVNSTHYANQTKHCNPHSTVFDKVSQLQKCTGSLMRHAIHKQTALNQRMLLQCRIFLVFWPVTKIKHFSEGGSTTCYFFKAPCFWYLAPDVIEVQEATSPYHVVMLTHLASLFYHISH